MKEPKSPLPWVAEKRNQYASSEAGTCDAIVCSATGEVVLDNQDFYPHEVDPKDQEYILEAANNYKPVLQLLYVLVKARPNSTLFQEAYNAAYKLLTLIHPEDGTTNTI